MLSPFKGPPELFDKVNFADAISSFYLCFFPPLSCRSVDGVERHLILLGHKCEPRASGVCLKILPGKSCCGWESEVRIQLTSLEDAHTEWKHYVAFKLLFLWYMRFYTTQKNHSLFWVVDTKWVSVIYSSLFCLGYVSMTSTECHVCTTRRLFGWKHCNAGLINWW